MNLREVGWEGVGWIHLAQGSDQWQFLWIWQWTFRFHERRGISWQREPLLASEEGLSPMELISYLLVN